MTHFRQIVLLLGLCLPAAHLFFLDFRNVSVESVLQNLILTAKTDVSPKCRQHSQIYMDQLRELKLWAAEMFDASSKFPSGVLFGSKVDFGNFDECVEVSVPMDDGETLQGQYCNVRFRVVPPNVVQYNRKFRYGYYEYDDVRNVSAWEKVVAFSNDRALTSRNDFFLSYCIPSSCTHQDLEHALRQTIEEINANSQFRIEVFVEPRNCQIKEPFSFSVSDLTYIAIVGLCMLVVLAASSYECCVQLQGLFRFKIQGKSHDIILAFSLVHNLKKLTTNSQNEHGLKSIHGLKVLSMFFVIMGHRIMFGLGSPILNPNFVESMYSRIEATVLLNGPIIVDTFFNITGFLVCYLMLQEFDKLKNVNILVIYLHRFVRLTPAYAVVLFFYYTLLIKMGSGPFWQDRIGIEQERCQASWWANLLYVNNYVNKDQICMFQSWYMTCDMHYFLIAPIIVGLLRRRPVVGLAALTGLIGLSVGVVFAVVFLNNEDGILLLYVNFLRDPVVHDTFKNIYIPSHMRASPYFVGMLAGYIKYKMRTNGYKMPNWMIYGGWLACIVVIEVTVYGAFIFYLPDHIYDPLVSAIYASFHHFTFSICISWMVVAISEGNGTWIDPIFSWAPLAYLSRITYTAFLCHGAIQLYTVSILRYSNYASVFNLVFNAAGDIVLSYVAGLVLSMFFEAPIISLEQALLRKRKETIKASPPPDLPVSTVESNIFLSNNKTNSHLQINA